MQVGVIELALRLVRTDMHAGPETGFAAAA